MITSNFSYSIVILVARCIIGTIFLFAGVRKIRYNKHFIGVVLSYQILPKVYSILLAHLLPSIEVVVGILLLLGITISLVSMICVVLLISFTVALGFNYWRGRRNLDCGCFGMHSSKISKTLLTRNLLLFILTVLLIILDENSYDLWSEYTNMLIDSLIPITLTIMGTVVIHYLTRYLRIIATKG